MEEGYCDLCLEASSNHLKDLVLRAVHLGYSTLAINTTVSDDPKDIKGGLTVPSPTTVHLTPADLGGRPSPTLLTRLTVVFINTANPFLLKNRAVMEAYDLLAYRPLTEQAYKSVCEDRMDVDIISLDVSGRADRLPRKLLKAAVKRNAFFEIQYGPLIGCSSPQSTLQLGRKLAALGIRCVIVSSGVADKHKLRAPNDVKNLARLLSLSLGAAGDAVSFACHSTLRCAALRRQGLNRAAPLVQVIPTPEEESVPEEVAKKRRLLAMAVASPDVQPQPRKTNKNDRL